MLQNAYFPAKIGADTAENEQHFSEILLIGRRVADQQGRRGRPAARPRGPQSVKKSQHLMQRGSTEGGLGEVSLR